MNPVRHALVLARFVLGVVLGAAAVAGEPPRQFFLELDIAIERGGGTGVLFDFGDGIWGENSAVANVPPGNTPHTVRLPLPDRPIRNLRFDPTVDDGFVLITGMRLVTERGEVMLRLDPKALRPMHQIQAILPEGTGVRIIPTPKADDPMLRLDLPPLQRRMHEAMQRATVGRGTVVGLGLLVGALVLTPVFAAGRALGRPAAGLGGAAIFVVVFGARLLLLDRYSRAVPFWDEWEGDVLYILMPFNGGFLDWGALFMPQWEHRILLTRVVTLFGTVLNGEWDPRVAMTVSAAMFSALIALLGTALLATRRWSGVFAALAIAGCAALPYDFNNLLWGGQTQMYGLLLLAVATISLAAAPQVTPLVGIGALAGGLISLFTMGAGLVGPACAAGICLVRAWFERGQRRSWLGLATIFIGVAVAGVFLHVSSRAHVPLYATTVAQFQRAFLGALAWPFSPRVAWATVVWLPWIINGALILRRREASALEWLAVGIGGWSLVNAIALGYARQYEGPPFDSRFFTSLSMGILASICSSVALGLRAQEWKGRGLAGLAGCAVAAGWMAIGVQGVAGAQENRATRADQEQRVRQFLATGDRTRVLEKPPHHTGADVADRLESPLLQQVLPAPYRRALAARVPPATAAAIEAGPITLAVRTLMKAGPVIALIGLLGLGAFIWRVRPSRGPPTLRAAPRWWTVLHRDVAGDRTCYVIAASVTIAWFFLYNHALRGCLVDEQGHIVDIHHFLDDKPGWPVGMPMLPGYHFIVLTVWKLYPAWEILTVARLVSTVMSLLGLAAFALTWRRIHGRPAGRATLLLALLPLSQPFTAMVYTDMPGLAFVLCAVWAQLTGRRVLAFLILVGAAGVRQTNLAWAGFLIAWEFLRTDVPRADYFRRIRWLIGLLAVAGALVLAVGRLTLGEQHGNDFRPNIAALHFGGVLVLLLGLPVWLTRGPDAVRGWRARQITPGRRVTELVLAAGVAGGLALTFANPHIWNRELFWEGCSFTLLRNWPLVWIDSYAWGRVASGVVLVVMGVAIALTFARQVQRRALWLALGFGALPVMTNSLVEPRYFIPGLALVLLFLDLEEVDWRRLAVWWAVLSVVHAPFVARAVSLW